MQAFKKYLWLGPLISGLLAFVSEMQVNFITSWIFYIPLFISVSNNSVGNTFKKGLFFGITTSAIAFFWMIPGAERFTGYSILYGVAVYLVSVFLFSIYQAIVFCSFAFIRKQEDTSFSLLINSLLIASIITFGESLLMYVSEGFPWFSIHAGSGLTANLYSIQAASVFGIYILTFIVVVVNYLVAFYVERRLYVKLFIPAAVFVCYMLIGFVLMQTFNSRNKKKQSFNVAILSENIPPDIKWDDLNGNMLVQKLLNLNKLAVTMKPAIMLWSESAIPWTYSKDDDLVKEVLKITKPADAIHILGINTGITSNEIYNSAYCILPGGTVAGRYDKQHLLSLIEKPLNGFLMPFFSSKGFVARNNVSHAAPLQTPHGRAGILICNEATIPLAAARMIKQGAQFLFNISNDGWFNNTYIVRVHFYYARLRAVESRKDLAVNCNNGYSGLIKASGDIEEMKRSEDPFVQMVTMEPNNDTTLVSKFPRLFVFIIVIYLVFIAAFHFISKYKDFKVLQNK